jgi:hypothetical protein
MLHTLPLMWRWTRITGAATTRRSIKRKAGGRYAADLVLQLPVSWGRIRCVHFAMLVSTQHLVDAIVREYEVTVLR